MSAGGISPPEAPGSAASQSKPMVPLDGGGTRRSAEPPKSAPVVNRLIAILLAFAGLFALTLVFFWSLDARPTTDFWWQAKTGELIWKSGHIPHHDPFSWTARGQPWVVQEWLADVLFYLLYARTPHWTLIAYKCGLTALACFLVLVRAWRRSGSGALGVGTALLAGAVAFHFSDLRPGMLSFVLAAALFWALDEYHAGLGTRRTRWIPWILPAAFLLWANLHGAVVVGLVLAALWTAGEAIGQWIYREPGPPLRPLLLGVGASALAAAVNPNGFGLDTYPFEVMRGHPIGIGAVLEWVSPDFGLPFWYPFLAILLATIAALPLTRRSPSGHGSSRFGEPLLLAASAYAALFAARNATIFALAATPLLAVAAAGLWREAADSHGIRARLGTIVLDPLNRVVGAALLACGLLLTVCLNVPAPPPRDWPAYTMAEASFPRAAADLLAAGAWPGRLFNSYDWGGYLIWRLWPQRQVFIDGREEVYDRNGSFDDWYTVEMARPGWEAVLDRRRVDVVLLRNGMLVADWLYHSSNWRLVYRTNQVVVFTRKTPLP